MAKLSIECKEKMVRELSTCLDKVDTLIVTSYKGLTAQDLNELRRKLRGISGEYLVVKNSMAKRAFAESSNNKILEFVEGDVGIAVDRKKEPSYISKVLVKFAKSHDPLKIRGGMTKGSIISKEDITKFAMLPSREVLLGRLANTLNAPMQGLARALSGIITKLAYALNAVKDQKSGVRGQRTEDRPQRTENKEGKKEEQSKELPAEDKKTKEETKSQIEAGSKKQDTEPRQQETTKGEDIRGLASNDETKEEQNG